MPVLFLLITTAQSLLFQADRPISQPASVMLTAYSTTLIANGEDRTSLRIVLIDSLSQEIAGRWDSVRVYVSGDARITTADGNLIEMHADTTGAYGACRLHDGVLNLALIAGTQADKVKVEARSGTLWPGAHEIHTLPRTFQYQQPSPAQLPVTGTSIGRMIGADISWLPQLEARGRTFYEGDHSIDAVTLLQKHGFNTIRLRIFVNPENEKGYSPNDGFCDLAHTLEMAQRVKAAGMQLLLDFHYSDFWADPQQQYKPERWADLDFSSLQDSIQAYTAYVLNQLIAQGTPADMVQIGNEINHGILWPDGHISNPDQLAALLQAGVQGTRSAMPGVPVMMHIALGGQNQEAVFWLDNMLARGVTFDIIGLSYYPRWHGTLTDLKANLQDLVNRYHKPVNVVEYSDFKREVHDAVFALPDGMGKGACIWEPLNRRSGLFDAEGHVTGLIGVYDHLHSTYLE